MVGLYNRNSKSKLETTAQKQDKTAEKQETSAQNQETSAQNQEKTTQNLEKNVISDIAPQSTTQPDIQASTAV